jgi:hypothetical protein
VISFHFIDRKKSRISFEFTAVGAVALVHPARACATAMKEAELSDRRSRKNKKAQVWQDPGFSPQQVIASVLTQPSI